MSYLPRFTQFREILREVLRAKQKRKLALNNIYRPFFEWKYGSGVYVMEEDWDNLILLDACRYDYFQQYVSLEGELSRKVSRGNGSWEFIQENFIGEDHHDTVYVTANPYSERLEQDVFYTVETVLDKWDSDIGTVLPEDVTDAAIEAEKEYPNKRLIVHYMQPHTPYIGETAREYNEKFGIFGFDRFRAIDGVENPTPGTGTFQLYQQRHISKEELSELYLETLQIAVSHVETLLDELSGKSVISSDHGENLGERQFGFERTGHTHDTKECRFVPWLEVPCDERKTVTEEPPIGFEYLEDRYVQDRLEDLGYL